MPLEFPSPADRTLARENAKQIAAALNSKVTTNRNCVLGSPDSPFKVPYHTDDFWFTVFVSDFTYTFQGNHKREATVATRARFSVTIKHPWRNMATSKRLTRLSDELGYDVFATAWDPEEAPSPYLLSSPVRALFRHLDLSPVHLFFLSAAQILVESELTDITQSINQVNRFRELLLTLAHTKIRIT